MLHLLRPDDVDNALPLVVHAKVGDAKLLDVVAEGQDLDGEERTLRYLSEQPS